MRFSVFHVVLTGCLIGSLAQGGDPLSGFEPKRETKIQEEADDIIIQQGIGERPPSLLPPAARIVVEGDQELAPEAEDDQYLERRRRRRRATEEEGIKGPPSSLLLDLSPSPFVSSSMLSDALLCGGLNLSSEDEAPHAAGVHVFVNVVSVEGQEGGPKRQKAVARYSPPFTVQPSAPASFSSMNNPQTKSSAANLDSPVSLWLTFSVSIEDLLLFSERVKEREEEEEMGSDGEGKGEGTEQKRSYGREAGGEGAKGPTFKEVEGKSFVFQVSIEGPNLKEVSASVGPLTVVSPPSGGALVLRPPESSSSGKEVEGGRRGEAASLGGVWKVEMRDWKDGREAVSEDAGGLSALSEGDVGIGQRALAYSFEVCSKQESPPTVKDNSQAEATIGLNKCEEWRSIRWWSSSTVAFLRMPEELTPGPLLVRGLVKDSLGGVTAAQTETFFRDAQDQKQTSSSEQQKTNSQNAFPGFLFKGPSEEGSPPKLPAVLSESLTELHSKRSQLAVDGQGFAKSEKDRDAHLMESVEALAEATGAALTTSEMVLSPFVRQMIERAEEKNEGEERNDQKGGCSIQAEEERDMMTVAALTVREVVASAEMALQKVGSAVVLHTSERGGGGNSSTSSSSPFESGPPRPFPPVVSSRLLFPFLDTLVALCQHPVLGSSLSLPPGFAVRLLQLAHDAFKLAGGYEEEAKGDHNKRGLVQTSALVNEVLKSVGSPSPEVQCRPPSSSLSLSLRLSGVFQAAVRSAVGILQTHVARTLQKTDPSKYTSVSFPQTETETESEAGRGTDREISYSKRGRETAKTMSIVAPHAQQQSEEETGGMRGGAFFLASLELSVLHLRGNEIFQHANLTLSKSRVLIQMPPLFSPQDFECGGLQRGREGEGEDDGPTSSPASALCLQGQSPPSVVEIRVAVFPFNYHLLLDLHADEEEELEEEKGKGGLGGETSFSKQKKSERVLHPLVSVEVFADSEKMIVNAERLRGQLVILEIPFQSEEEEGGEGEGEQAEGGTQKEDEADSRSSSSSPFSASSSGWGDLCGFFDPSSGRMSREGCQTREVRPDRLVCACAHLSDFAAVTADSQESSKTAGGGKETTTDSKGPQAAAAAAPDAKHEEEEKASQGEAAQGVEAAQGGTPMKAEAHQKGMAIAASLTCFLMALLLFLCVVARERRRETRALLFLRDLEGDFSRGGAAAEKEKKDAYQHQTTNFTLPMVTGKKGKQGEDQKCTAEEPDDLSLTAGKRVSVSGLISPTSSLPSASGDEIGRLGRARIAKKSVGFLQTTKNDGLPKPSRESSAQLYPPFSPPSLPMDSSSSLPFEDSQLFEEGLTHAARNPAWRSMSMRMSGTELGGGPRGGTGAVAREGVGMDAAAVFSDGEEIGGDGEEEPEEEGQEEGEEGGSAGSLGTSVSLSDGGGSERDQEEGGADVGGGGKKTFQAEHTGVHGAPPVRRESSVTLTDSDGSSEGVTPTSQQEQRESLEHPTAILPRHPAHTARPGYEADQWQRCESPGGRERSPATRQSEGFALYHSRHSFGTMMHSMSQLTDLSSASADSLGSLSSDLEEEGLRLELSRSASVAMAGGGALGDNLNKRRRSIQQGTSPSHLASLRSCLRLWRRDLTKALPVPGLFLFPFSKLSLTEKAAVFFFQQNLTLLMCAVFSFLVDGAILGWAAVGSLSSLVGWGGAKVSNASLRCTPRPNMGGEGGGIGRRGTNFRVGGGAGGRLAGPRSSLYLQPRGRQNKRAAVVTAGLFAGGVGMGVTALVLVGVAPLSSPSLHLVCLFATLFSVVLSYLCFPVVDSLLLAGRRGLRALLLPSQTGGRDRRKSRTSMRKSPFSSINLA